LSDFEHMVIVVSPNMWSHLAKRVWCVQHGIHPDDFYIRTTSSTDAWFFKDSEDATAFKLRFGDRCPQE
jgi:hypothetical protein